MHKNSIVVVGDGNKCLGDTIQGKTRIHYISLEKEGKGSVKIRRGKLMGSRIFVSVLYCEKNRDLPEEMVFLVFHFFFSVKLYFQREILGLYYGSCFIFCVEKHKGYSMGVNLQKINL